MYAGVLKIYSNFTYYLPLPRILLIPLFYRNDDETATDTANCTIPNEHHMAEQSQSKFSEQRMYIQMEYCEKNTLR